MGGRPMQHAASAFTSCWEWPLGHAGIMMISKKLVLYCTMKFSSLLSRFQASTHTHVGNKIKRLDAHMYIHTSYTFIIHHRVESGISFPYYIDDQFTRSL
jgi:hypothetical protein